MYSVLIVDDERLIRNGLRDMIPWQELGVGQVYTAADARQALARLKAQPIDLLLTDICMPEINGLEMVRQLEKHGPPPRTIVLTGYNDFEYARQCCSMEVHDFLLKPICEERLMESVRRQIEQMERRHADERQDKAKSRAREMGDAHRLEWALRGLAHQEHSLANTADILARYGYSLQQPLRAALVIPPLLPGQGWPEENELRLLSIKHICLEMVDARHLGITFEDGRGCLGIVFFEGDDVGDTYNLLKQISGRVQDELSTAPKVIMGGTVKGFQELHISWSDITLLEKETGGQHEGVYPTGHVVKRMEAFFSEYESKKMQLCACLADEEQLLEAMGSLRALFERSNLSLHFLRRCCLEVAGSAYLTFLLENGGEAENRLTVLLELVRCATRSDTLAFTQDFLLRLFPRDQTNSNHVVQRAKSYINSHLAEDLSVSSLAARLYINANYFSKLFKQTTGEGCNEYITRKRMERAKKLLEGSAMKTGRVAEEVGYKDKNYFSLAFKKYSGLAPTAYRMKARG